jgi:hypothetical protein
MAAKKPSYGVREAGSCGLKTRIARFAGVLWVALNLVMETKTRVLARWRRCYGVSRVSDAISAFPPSKLNFLPAVRSLPVKMSRFAPWRAGPDPRSLAGP